MLNFLYDEYLNLLFNEERFSIQIEDSEGMTKHKSNLVEAVLRYHKNDTIDAETDKNINDVLAYFGYVMIDNMYAISGKEQKISETSIIYKAYPAFWKIHNNR